MTFSLQRALYRGARLLERKPPAVSTASRCSRFLSLAPLVASDSKDVASKDMAYRFSETPYFTGSRVRKSPFFPSMLRQGLRDCTVYNRTLMPVSWDTHTNLDEYWSLVNDCIIWDVSCQRQVEFKGAPSTN